MGSNPTLTARLWGIVMNKDVKIRTVFSTPIITYRITGISDFLDVKTREYYGHQTERSLHTLPEFDDLCKIIQKLIHKISTGIYHFKDQYEFEITQMWLNVITTGNYFRPHTHSNSYWSGVLFLDGEEGEFPPLILENPVSHQLTLASEEFNQYNSDVMVMNCLKDLLVVFPSHLIHHVPTNFAERERLSISFNVLPRGQYDDDANLQGARI